MGKIVAIANQKGGVGKTTTCHNLAYSFGKRGKKILMVDMDAQASLTISCGLEPLQFDYTIVDLFEKKQTQIEKSIYKMEDTIDIIPSCIDLSAIEMEILSRTSREKILDRALQTVKKNYDYILIDCPPQLSILTLNALSCADKVVIPVKTDYLAYRGLEQLLSTVAEVKKLINSNIKVSGVVATMYEKGTKTDNDILELLQSKYNVIGIIKKAAVTKKGLYDGKCVVEKYPKDEIAIVYNEIASKIEGEK